MYVYMYDVYIYQFFTNIVINVYEFYFIQNLVSSDMKKKLIPLA